MKINLNDRYTPASSYALGEGFVLDPVGDVVDDITEGGLRARNRAVDLSLYTRKDITDVEDNEAQVLLNVKQSEPDPVSEAMLKRADLETIKGASQKNYDFQVSDDFILEGALAKGDPNFSPALYRSVINKQIAQEMVQERFEEALQSSTGKATWDFLDYYLFRYFVGIGWWEDLNRRNVWEGRARAIDQASLTPEEFKREYAQLLDEIAEEGVFTEENYFAIKEEMMRSENAGFAPEANLGAGLALVDAGLILFKPGTSLVRAGVKGLEAGLQPTRTAGRAAAVGGRQEGNRVIDSAQGTRLANEEGIMLDSMPEGMNPEIGPNVPRPADGATSYSIERNGIIREVQKLVNQGVFGRVADPADSTQIIEETMEWLETVSTRPISAYRPMKLELGRKGVEVDFGKAKDGLPYNREQEALNYADTLRNRGLSAKVVELDEGGYVVRVQQRVDLTTAEEAVDVFDEWGAVRGSVIGKALGSTALIDAPHLDVLAKLGEQGMSSIADVAQPYIKTFEKVNNRSKETIGEVFRQWRDGTDVARTSPYTTEEFKVLFKQYHPFKADATPEDIDAYYALLTMNDAAYIMKANASVDRFVRLGYKTIDFKKKGVPAKVAEPAGDTDVLDMRTGRMVKAKELKDQTIWRTNSWDEDVPEYLANPPAIREVQRGDVLPYNGGGYRTNPDMHYMVTLGDGQGRVVVGAFTKKEAAIARTELSNIQAAVKQTGKKVDELTDELDEVIQANNKWNPNITNTAELASFLTKNKLDIRGIVNTRARDEIVRTGDELTDGMTYGDYIMLSRKRQEDVMTQFGGAQTFNYNPVRTISEGLSSASFEFSMANYTQRAKTAWVKALYGGADKIPPNRSINSLFNEDIPKGMNAEKLETLRNIIRRREFHKSPGMVHVQNTLQSVSEWVFDKTGGKIKMRPGDPVNELLTLGFQSAFGFFNAFQFFLQGSHSIAIAAISPKYGSKAMAMALPWRLVMQTGSDTAIRRMAAASGLDFKEVKEMYEYMRTSGRYNVDMDAAEKLTMASFGVSGYSGSSQLPSAVRDGLYAVTKTGKKALDVGLTPFREGERLSRITGQLTAMLEYKAANPGRSLMTDAARTWITRREHDLTLNMTTGSRAAFQDGLMRLPTQWMSHSMRMFESVIVGRNLSKGERARLATFMVAIGGTYGLGQEAATDDLAEHLGLEPNSPGFAALKYGFLDGIMSYGLSELTDQEVRTAIGTRMSPTRQFIDLYNKVVEENAITALGGPSAEITSGFVGNLTKATHNVLNGYPESATIDAAAAVRALAGVDNLYKAIAIANYGTFTTRTGAETPFKDMTNIDAVLQALGVTNFDTKDLYSRNQVLYWDTKKLKDYTKDIKADYRKAITYIRDGDRDKGLRLMNEVAERIHYSGFHPTDKESIRRSLTVEFGNDYWELAVEYLKRDNRFGAEAVEGIK